MLMRRNSYKAIRRCRIKSMKSKIPRNGNQCIGQRLALDRRVHTYSVAGRGKGMYVLRCILFFVTPWPVTHQSFAHGILHATILKWVAISYSRGLPSPRMKPTSLSSPALADGFFTTVLPREPRCLCRLFNVQ